MKVERKGSGFRQTKGGEEIRFRFLCVFQSDPDCQLDLHRGLGSELEPDSGHIMASWDWSFVRSRNEPLFFDPIDVKGASRKIAPE